MKMNKSLVTRFVFAAILAVAVAATGCGTDTAAGGGSGGAGSGGDGGGAAGGGGDGGGGGTVIPGAVTADPPDGTTFVTSQTVTLSTDGDGPIYYTTDLTSVVDEDGNVQGMEYVDPIPLNATTVVKFLALLDPGAGGAGGDSGATYSPEQWSGYVRTNGDSKTEEWANSGHGHISAEAWRHWDEDTEVPGRCAKCHSAESVPGVGNSLGFLQFATTGGNADPAPLPLGLECAACHERSLTIYDDLETYSHIEPVLFPSQAELSVWSESNICMTCHQGRESGLDVKDTIADDNGVGPYTFINIHYYPAAASVFGGEADGGFQYAGKDYRPRNSFPSHPDNYANCVGCHMRNAEGGESHTWQVGVDNCTGCHNEGDSFETLRGSPNQSYENLWGADGGSSGLVDDLYAAIQDYAVDVCINPETDDACGPITYDSHAYPYWFNDNGEGASYGNRYTSFDAKLLAAAYNYQVAQKDPAGFIHNGTYTQQILYDSTMDLGGTTAVQVAGRGDLELNGAAIGSASKSQQWHISGHGALDEEPFRHWDEDEGVVSGSCSRCHTSAGFTEYATNVATTPHLATRGVDCVACHESANLFGNTATRWDTAIADGGMQNLEPVLFPSGASLTLTDVDNGITGEGNMCMGCHMGRSSGLDVDTQADNEVDNGVTPSFDFINIHYYAAAATLFGSEANGGYQYMGEAYAARNSFVGLHNDDTRDLRECIGCHMNSNPDPGLHAKHTFLPAEVDDCSECHNGGPRFRDLSTAPRTNFNAIASLVSQLYTAIQDYAADGGLGVDSPVMYDSHAYPYWFYDNGMGANYGNRYRDFDRELLRAAYNYQVALKDPAGYIHNGTYMQQILWDSIVALGACPNLNPPPIGRPPMPDTCL